MKGKKCKWSARGLLKLRRSRQEHRGTIVGETRDGFCWNVHWDHQATMSRDCLHKNFIEVLS